MQKYFIPFFFPSKEGFLKKSLLVTAESARF